MSTQKPGPNSRPQYRALRELQPRQEPCGVPGCEGLRVTEDCCYPHSLNKSNPAALANDGVIDWLAIDLAVEAAREVRLTWVESNIAAARLLMQGCSEQELIARLHMYLKSESRRQEIRSIIAGLEAA